LQDEYTSTPSVGGADSDDIKFQYNMAQTPLNSGSHFHHRSLHNCTPELSSSLPYGLNNSPSRPASQRTQQLQLQQQQRGVNAGGRLLLQQQQYNSHSLPSSPQKLRSGQQNLPVQTMLGSSDVYRTGSYGDMSTYNMMEKAMPTNRSKVLPKEVS